MAHTIAWLNNLDDALGAARREDKPIFVDWSDLPSCVGCISLEHTTYPSEEVASYVTGHFIPVQLNQSQLREFFDEKKIIWTPTVTVCDRSGQEQDRWVGFLPPQEFLPRLKLSHARLEMYAGDYGRAAEILGDIVKAHPHSLFTAEALYWLGVAKIKVNRDLGELTELWAKLMESHPQSEWAQKASCLF